MPLAFEICGPPPPGPPPRRPKPPKDICPFAPSSVSSPVILSPSISNQPPEACEIRRFHRWEFEILRLADGCFRDRQSHHRHRPALPPPPFASRRPSLTAAFGSFERELASVVAGARGDHRVAVLSVCRPSGRAGTGSRAEVLRGLPGVICGVAEAQWQQPSRHPWSPPSPSRPPGPSCLKVIFFFITIEFVRLSFWNATQFGTAAGRNQCKNGYFFCRNPLSCARNEQAAVIDDEEDVRYSFERIFNSPDIELATASSGEEGLKGIPNSSPTSC